MQGEADATAQGRRCAYCGSPVDESARYCPACGRLPHQPAADVDIARWMKRGWEMFVSNIGPAIAIPLVMLGPLLALAIIGYFGFIGAAFAASAFEHTHARAGAIVAAVMAGIGGLIVLSLLLVLPALSAGIYACFLDAVRGGRLTAARLGAGFRSWWACTWVSWALGAGMVACLPFMVILVGMPVFYGLLSLWWLSLLRIVDQQRGGLEALDFAWQTMRGRMWMMLLFTFLMFTLMNAGMAAMYLGMLVTTPIAMAALTAAYDDLSARKMR